MGLFGGNVSVERIRVWVENNINIELGEQIEQYLEDKNVQNIEVTFEDVDEVKWSRVTIRNESNKKILFAFMEKFLSEQNLDTTALEKIDKLQDSENFGSNYSASNIDKTIINAIGLARYLDIKQQVRLQLTQNIRNKFTRVKRVDWSDVLKVNENYVETYQTQLIDEVAKTDSKLAEELQEKIKQKDKGIKFGEIAWVLFGVAGILVAVYMIRGQTGGSAPYDTPGKK